MKPPPWPLGRIVSPPVGLKNAGVTRPQPPAKVAAPAQSFARPSKSLPPQATANPCPKPPFSICLPSAKDWAAGTHLARFFYSPRDSENALSASYHSRLARAA